MTDMLMTTYYEFKIEGRKVYIALLTQPLWFSLPLVLYSLFWNLTVGVTLHVLSLIAAVISILISGVRDKVSPNLNIAVLPDPIAFAQELKAYYDLNENKKVRP